MIFTFVCFRSFYCGCIAPLSSSRPSLFRPKLLVNSTQKRDCLTSGQVSVQWLYEFSHRTLGHTVLDTSFFRRNHKFCFPVGCLNSYRTFVRVDFSSALDSQLTTYYIIIVGRSSFFSPSSRECFESRFESRRFCWWRHHIGKERKGHARSLTHLLQFPFPFFPVPPQHGGW